MSTTSERLTLDVESIAAGGHCVAHHDGTVVFVRYALPGERVVARITGSGKGGRFLRAVTEEVIDASPHRVEPRCEYFGRCGGCDFQHVDWRYQHELKTSVLRDALRRIGGFDDVDDVVVVAVSGDVDGYSWRSKLRLTKAAAGALGFRGHRSHDIVPIDQCAIASIPIPEERDDWGSEVVVAAGTDGRTSILNDGVVVSGRRYVTHEAIGRQWRVDVDGFWQAHPMAAQLLAEEVVARAQVRSGDRVADLYSGVGLFAAALVGDADVVHAVESSASAVKNATRNLHDLPDIRIHHADVAAWLDGSTDPLDVVVCDPPRSGLGAELVAAVTRRGPRRWVYVSCDPASLARDLKAARDLGWLVSDISGFDLFPMTQHIETVVTLSRS